MHQFVIEDRRLVSRETENMSAKLLLAVTRLQKDIIKKANT